MPIRQSAEQRLHELNSAEAYLGAAARTLAALNSSEVPFGDAVDEAVRRSPALQFAPGSEPEWISTLRELIERERARVRFLGRFDLPFWIDSLKDSKPANAPRIASESVALAQEFEREISKLPPEITWGEADWTWDDARAQRTWDARSDDAREVARRICDLFDRGSLWKDPSLRKSRMDAARKRLANHLERAPGFSFKGRPLDGKSMSLREALALAAHVRANDGRSARR